MRVNFWGVVHGTKAFLPYLHRTDAAHIVNTASIFGAVAVPGQAASTASKFAVRGFAERASGSAACCLAVSTPTSPGNAAPTREAFERRFDALARLTPREAARMILQGVRKNPSWSVATPRHWRCFHRLLPERYPAVLRWSSARMGPAKRSGLARAAARPYPSDRARRVLAAKSRTSRRGRSSPRPRCVRRAARRCA
jgi:NAD(P)-dependent dehydrogenase (short-subunit alcohol dehydrogenase family)